MTNLLGLSNIIDYIWFIPIIFTIHEFEEWNILRWYKKYYKNIPESTNTSIRIHIVVFGLVSFLLTFLAYLLNTTFVFSLVVAFMSAFIFFNVIQHIIWTIQLRAYSPGLTTGIVSLIVVGLVNMELIANGLVIIPFYAVIALTALPIAKTLKVKGEMTPEIRKVHEFFIEVERALRKRATISR